MKSKRKRLLGLLGLSGKKKEGRVKEKTKTAVSVEV